MLSCSGGSGLESLPYTLGGPFPQSRVGLSLAGDPDAVGPVPYPPSPPPPRIPAPPSEIPWLPRAIRCMIGNAMPDVQQERERLAETDRHIAEDEERLAIQLRLMEWMFQGGHTTAFAEECLLRLRQDFGHWRARRQLIVDAMARR